MPVPRRYGHTRRSNSPRLAAQASRSCSQAGSSLPYTHTLDPHPLRNGFATAAWGVMLGESRSFARVLCPCTTALFAMRQPQAFATPNEVVRKTKGLELERDTLMTEQAGAESLGSDETCALIQR